MSNPVYFSFREAVVAGEFNRLQPELTYYSLTLDVNMHRFVTVEAIEKEPVGAGNILDRGHGEEVYSACLRSCQR